MRERKVLVKVILVVSKAMKAIKKFDQTLISKLHNFCVNFVTSSLLDFLAFIFKGKSQNALRTSILKALRASNVNIFINKSYSQLRLNFT